ncbi:MAG: type 4 pili biogenesis protein (nuleotide-binding protein) [Coxiella sp. (in: Bacteria)]|nr:MAG: type 4 pili biogenesis protein (nuleotide-binding protein) [Coxiella sp. (in: g-proteobacteria)]
MDMPISALANALINTNLITHTQAQALEANARLANLDLADYLHHHTRYASNDVAAACALYFGLEHVSLSQVEQPHFVKNILYFTLQDESIAAIYRPLDMIHTKPDQRLAFISADDFFTLRDTVSRPSDTQYDDKTSADQLNKILAMAILHKASDIHFEPHAAQVLVRLRIDGLLQNHSQLLPDELTRITTRLKVLSNTDITQSRLPQDGRFSYTFDTDSFDCRISFCPTIYGEKLVIRILNACQHVLQFTELGLEPDQKELLIQALNRNQGLVLVTGPTGSGKTQTLYTALNHLNQSTTNISTIEDPVEIKLAGINQINVDDNLGLSFARVLRALLRQDPDIIMIGEIRDHETAELAVRAAQTGHLVLATLHTQSAVEAITRLENLGVSRFNIATTLTLVITQRLVRKLSNNKLKGRIGVFELLNISPLMQYQIIEQKSSLDLRKLALADGFHDLWHQGKLKVARHITTQDELIRVGIDALEVAHENS